MKIIILLLISSMVFACSVPSVPSFKTECKAYSGGAEYGNNTDMIDTYKFMIENDIKLTEADMRFMTIVGSIFLVVGILYCMNVN